MSGYVDLCLTGNIGRLTLLTVIKALTEGRITEELKPTALPPRQSKHLQASANLWENSAELWSQEIPLKWQWLNPNHQTWTELLWTQWADGQDVEPVLTHSTHLPTAWRLRSRDLFKLHTVNWLWLVFHISINLFWFWSSKCLWLRIYKNEEQLEIWWKLI